MTDDEISKVARDAFTYGTGFMRDGKHVPMENVYMTAKDAATKDLVTRLRIGAPTIEKCYEAADRIEQLETALRNCCDKWENGNGACEWMEAVDEARAALGEKK
jgi:hypothetical protein